MYLLPQDLGRRIFVATTVAYYFCGNSIKLVPYFWQHLITWETLTISLFLVPAIPIGTALGVWLNRRLREDVFLLVVYVLLFGTGSKLLYDVITA